MIGASCAGSSLETCCALRPSQLVALDRRSGRPASGASQVRASSRRRRCSSRATSSSRRSSSSPWPTASSSPAHNSTSPRPSRDQLERLAQPGLAGVQPPDDLLDARGRGLVGAGWRPARRSWRRPVLDGRIRRRPSAKRSAHAPRRRAPRAALVTSSPARVLDERVAARRACAAGRARRARARSRSSSPRRARPRADARGRAPCATARQRAALGPARSLARRRAARAARISRSCWCRRAALAGDVLGGRARQRGERARPVERPRGGRAPSQAAAPRAAAPRAPRRSRSGTAASAACVGVEQLTAATSSSSVRSVWWPTEAITGTPQQRDRAAQRLVAEAEAGRPASRRRARRRSRRPRAIAARSCSARAIAGAAWRSCTGANAHTSRPAQPRRAQPGEHVVARLARLAGDDADRARQRGRGQPLLRLEAGPRRRAACAAGRAARAGRPRRRRAGR